MNILHVSDTHLGYSAYRKLADNGLNQREMDVYSSFNQFVEYALTVKPDFILHSGDLFDSVRPTNRAITFALTQLLRLSKAGIPFLVISGNHETPKLLETGNVFRIFEHLEHIYPIYKGDYEVHSIGEAKVHCIPHTPTGDTLQASLEQVQIDPSARNILMLHVGIRGMKEFRMGEFNEHIIPKNTLSPDFDYIALGHYHGGEQVTENAFYAGSTERFSFKETEETKGFREITITDTVSTRFMPLKTRDMVTLKIDCTETSLHDVQSRITDLIKGVVPQEKIIRLFLQDIPRHLYNTLDVKAIHTITQDATHFELIPDIRQEEQSATGAGTIGTLMEEWHAFFDQQSLGKDSDTIRDIALQYLSEADG